MTVPLTAPQLLRGAGLLADGPVLWGRPLSARDPGVYIIELADPATSAPLDLTLVAKWIEQVPQLRLDGQRPTPKDLAGRLADYWLPDQGVVWIGSSKGSLSSRIAALQRTPLGHPAPYPGAHWLLTLRGLDKSRIWWAATNAPLEYEDALLDAFADGVASEVRQAAPEPQLVLPFAVRRRPTGERRRHGITDALLGEVPAPDPVPGRSASGAPSRSRATSPRRADGQPRRTPAPRRPRISEPATRRADTAVHLSPEGLEQLRVELRQLREIGRPAAVKRLVAARELGDLKENGDYIAAREELGFIDGRLQMLDNRLQNVVVADGPTTAVASLGSTVVVRIDDMVLEYRLVGSPEADVGAGRISTSSPVGRALVGHVAGDEVVVTTPGGEQRFSIVEVR